MQKLSPAPDAPGQGTTPPSILRTISPLRGGRWIRATALLVSAIVLLPVIAVVASLFGRSQGSIAHLAQKILGEVLLNTAGLLLLVGVGTVTIGTTTAWLVTMHRFPGSRALQWLLMLPMAMPAFIIGYAYTDVLSFPGPVQTWLRAVFGWRKGDYWFPEAEGLIGASAMLTLVLYPYVYFLARVAFLDQSANALEVARTLGQNAWSRFFRVALPLARPAIAAGAALALMETIADFGTVQYFGVNTFTTVIYRTWFGMGDPVAARQLASALLVLVISLLALERWARQQGRFHRTGRKELPLRPTSLAGWQRIAAMAACWLPVVLGFLLPTAILVGLHIEGGEDPLGPRFLALARNSFSAAAAAAMLVTTIAAVVAYALRLSHSRHDRALLRLATLGYALPGTVVAVGLLATLGAFDAALDVTARSILGVSTGLILSGTIAALLLAYCVRFLAVAAGSLESGLAKIPPSIDQVARTLGCNQTGVLLRIHIPLLSRSLLTATMLVFADVLKELPATLIVRPFNFETLAVRVYQLASDERLAQASTSALLIVAIGLVPIVLLNRAMSRGSQT